MAQRRPNKTMIEYNLHVLASVRRTQFKYNKNSSNRHGFSSRATRVGGFLIDVWYKL